MVQSGWTGAGDLDGMMRGVEGSGRNGKRRGRERKVRTSLYE